jgi:predicted dehydrogenase
MGTLGDRTLSVGVVGAGEIARIAHLPVLAAMEGVALDWIADRDPTRARTLARGFGARAVPLPGDLTELPEADIVLLALPYGARPAYYAALEGREAALLVEKPLFRSVEEHLRHCERFPAHRFGQAFTRRSMGSSRLVRRLVEERPFGRLRALAVGFGRPGSVAGNYQSDLALAGGGMLFDSAIHALDLIFFLSGARAQRLSEARMIADSGFDLHTEAALTLVTPDGDEVACRLEVSCLRETSNRLELGFEHARVVYSAFDPSGRVTVCGAGGGAWRLAPDAGPYATTHFQIVHEHWRRFVEGLRAGSANETSAHDTLETTRLVEACYARAQLAADTEGCA